MENPVPSLSKDGRALQPWFDRLTTGLVQDGCILHPRPELVEGQPRAPSRGSTGLTTGWRKWAACSNFVLSLSKDGLVMGGAANWRRASRQMKLGPHWLPPSGVWRRDWC